MGSKKVEETTAEEVKHAFNMATNVSWSEEDVKKQEGYAQEDAKEIRSLNKKKAQEKKDVWDR